MNTPEEGLYEFWPDEETHQQQQQEQPNKPNGTASGWDEPDMGILRLRRRAAPPLPLEVFGDAWGQWIEEAAAAAACPPDYVALPLLSSASTLIGHARWAQATPGWTEPPHLWTCAVGDSGDGKSPGSDCLHRDVLPVLESRMVGDFPERLREWQASTEADKAAKKHWVERVRQAQEDGKIIPPPPRPTVSDVAPERPRLRQHDVTIEQIAVILATAAPKGVVVVRDELAGWLDGMNSYNPSGRAFWIEGYGGRRYTVERRKHGKEPIEIPRFAVAVSGGTQPDRLAKLIDGTDDGLLSRIQWGWPNPVPFRLGQETPRIGWAIDALDRLRELDLQPGDPPSPVLVPLVAEGPKFIEEFGRDMQVRRESAGGLLRSAFGKARGTALRLSLVLEWLWWIARDGMDLPPAEISTKAFVAAAVLVSDYFMPMAERVYGDAAATEIERAAATLARWIVREQPKEVHVRELQRDVRLSGLRTAEQIKKAADSLVEADWLRAPVKGTAFGQRGRIVYLINPKLSGA